MRIAAIATLAGLLFLQVPATAQNTVTGESVEPPLDEIIARFFPGYVPVTPGDLSADVRAITARDPNYNHPDRSPTVIRADFDGNGFADYAVLVRELASNSPDEVFAILMGYGDGRYAAAMKAFFGALMGEVYLAFVPPEQPLTTVTAAGGGAATMLLPMPSVRLTYYGRASDVFYWDGDLGRFESVPLRR